MLIGLAGTYCAGKNHIASLLEARGLPVLDVDKLGYKVLETEKETIFKQFGADLQKSDSSLDRRLLGQRVFKNPEKLNLLEAIVHPSVNRLTEEWIAQNRDRACIINAALLHKSSVFKDLERLILVTAPFFTRFLRARKRDNLSWLEILRRFTRQRDFNSQYITVNANHVFAEIYKVENPGLFSSRNLQKKLENRIEEIMELIKF